MWMCQFPALKWRKRLHLMTPGAGVWMVEADLEAVSPMIDNRCAWQVSVTDLNGLIRYLRYLHIRAVFDFQDDSRLHPQVAAY
jgi:hypothetical protein